jgi:DNA polymerase I
MTTLYIDGDILLHQASSATEFACDWGDGLWVLSGNLEQSSDLVEQTLDNLRQRFETRDLVIALSDSENFRKDLSPTYKSHRKGRKPLVYGPLKDWLLDEYYTETWYRLEADDVLGILITQDPHGVCVSCDKDMLTVPGVHFKSTTEGLDAGELIIQSQEAADRQLLIQTLTGDSTDGYSGLPGCGPKTAEKILSPHATWGAVVAAYEAKGFTEADALMNARMARILRNTDWDFEKQEVKLWVP